MISELFYSHVLNMNQEVPFTQEVSCVYTSPFLDTDGLKMALLARKVSGAFEKRDPELFIPLDRVTGYVSFRRNVFERSLNKSTLFQ